MIAFCGTKEISCGMDGAGQRRKAVAFAGLRECAGRRREYFNEWTGLENL